MPNSRPWPIASGRYLVDRNETTASRTMPFPAWCAALAIGGGLLVLVGWAAGVETLKRIAPGLVAMNPATAALFLLAGISLWLQLPGSGYFSAGHVVADATDARQRLARLLAGAVTLLAALKLGGECLGWSSGVDQWLFADRLADGGAVPNRMAPNTAFNFLLLGLALFLLRVTTARGRRPSEYLAGMVGIGGLFGLLGYIFQFSSIRVVPGYTPMALHTAAVFLLLTFGVLGARPRLGLMAVVTGPGPGGVLVRRLYPALVLTVMTIGWLRLEGERRDLYGEEFGVTLYTTAFIAMCTVLVAWSAVSLHRAEALRKRVAAVRDQALALNRLIMDNSLDVICAIDGEGRFVEVSAAALQLWGYAPSELIGRAYADLVHPDDAAKTAKAAAEVTAGQPTADFSHRYLRKDGSPIDIDWSAIWSEVDGLMFCVARDATRRKQAEELLRQSQAQTRAIIATASDAFVAIDRFGLIIDWNVRAESAFGWPRAEALGRLLSQTIIPHQHRQAHDRGLDHYLATGEGPVLNKPIEITALRRDGHEFPIELTIWPVTTPESTTFNAFVRDITQRRQAEQAIQTLNAELQANAEQLQQSNRELEAFSYSISHDLRAPLRHIDGYARMLHEDAGDQLDTEMRRYLDAISDGARQMGALIDDLLAFSKLGRKPVQRVDVDMEALVQRVAEELRVDGDPRVSIGPLPEALADPVLFKQVWLNLLSNAIKYSAPRGDKARVEVSGERTGDRVQYRIRDNGVGFDMRYADKLFGVFQRLHSQDEFEGTGVGLAIVQRIVARHGGSIAADSQLGLGATFTFELPLGAEFPSDTVTMDAST